VTERCSGRTPPRRESRVRVNQQCVGRSFAASHALCAALFQRCYEADMFSRGKVPNQRGFPRRSDNSQNAC